jgi:hypothetical protein
MSTQRISPTFTYEGADLSQVGLARCHPLVLWADFSNLHSLAGAYRIDTDAEAVQLYLTTEFLYDTEAARRSSCLCKIFETRIHPLENG